MDQIDLYRQWYDLNQIKSMEKKAITKEAYWKEGFRVGIEEAIDEIRCKMTIDDQERMDKAIGYLKRLIES